MREIPEYFNRSTKSLSGVGDKLYEAFYRLGCTTNFLLLTHFPTRIIFHDVCKDLDALPVKSETILELKFLEVHNSKGSKVKKVICEHNGTPVELLYFNYFPYYFFNNKKYGEKIIVLGTVRKDSFKGVQVAHPLLFKTISEVPKFAIIYPLTYAITSHVIHKFVNLVLQNIDYIVLPEWIGESILSQNSWSGFIESLQNIHNPKSSNDIHPNSPYRRRLAFDELLASQLAIGMVRRNRTVSNGVAVEFRGDLKKKVLDKLGFTLTEGQALSLEEIEEEQKSNNRMVRLLQGDVGSGKTLVSLCAMLNAVEAGYQSALMAPTDILANQHFQFVSKTLEGTDVRTELLTGKITGSRRKEILKKLQDGEIDILIGTHAIFQEAVTFCNLRMVIVDEQHRFGVQQRMALMNKGKDSDVLVMSATPIPRTLSMTMYGDMDISVLAGKPKGRMPITTYSLQEAKIEKILGLIENKLVEKEKVYWICPLIEGDPENDNIAVENRFAYLKKKFGDKVGLLHGKLTPQDKEQVMNDFAFGDVDILVSTTVVEVGVDVPEATLIIIEGPDRFGLAQLHQLRGRVGRGSKQSECVLLYTPDRLTKSTVSKIKIMKDSNDGFYLAEQDLKLRGGGSLLGNKQSGLPGFRVADLEFHSDLLSEANKYAKELLKNSCARDVQDKIALLLEIFGYKENFKLIESG